MRRSASHLKAHVDAARSHYRGLGGDHDLEQGHLLQQLVDRARGLPRSGRGDAVDDEEDGRVSQCSQGVVLVAPRGNVPAGGFAQAGLHATVAVSEVQLKVGGLSDLVEEAAANEVLGEPVRDKGLAHPGRPAQLQHAHSGRRQAREQLGQQVPAADEAATGGETAVLVGLRLQRGLDLDAAAQPPRGREHHLAVVSALGQQLELAVLVAEGCAGVAADGSDAVLKRVGD